MELKPSEEECPAFSMNDKVELARFLAREKAYADVLAN